jgi:hypothetical protein
MKEMRRFGQNRPPAALFCNIVADGLSLLTRRAALAFKRRQWGETPADPRPEN